MLTPRDLAARAVGHRFANEAAINRWLADQGITDPTERLSYKLELMAQGALATDQTHAPGTLATDLSRHTPETAPLGPEVARLFRRAGLEPGRSYSPSEVDAALQQCDMDTTSRIAVKAELMDKGWLKAAGTRHVTAAWARDMTAAAERPQSRVLTDRQGRPLVLRSRP